MRLITVLSGDRVRSVGLGGLTLGALIGVDPFGWDEVGPLRWLLVSAFGFAVIAASAGRVPRDRLTLVWAALIAWLAVAALFGADRFHGWVGTPDRHYGWLTWLLCGGLFLVARQAPADGANQLVARAVVIATVTGLAVALAEAFGWSLGEVEFAGDRLGGAFSQPALLGAASVLVLPVCASMLRCQPMGWRIAAAVATLGALFTLVASQARAAWLAAALVAVVAAWARRSDLRTIWRAADGRRRAVAIAAVAGFCVISGVAAQVGSRVRSLFGSGGGLAGRVDEWQVAVRTIQARPVTGWGPEGYRIAFARHVDVEYVIEHGRTVITDRAHASVLDAAVIGGLPAGLLYVAVLALVAAALWRTVRDGDYLQVGLALGAFGYFAQQLVLFPLAELDPLAWLLAGLAIGPALPATSRVPSISIAPTVRGLAAGLAGIALLAGALDVVADHRIARAESAPDPQQALADADGARSLRGDSIRYDFIAGRFADRIGPAKQAALDRVASGLAISPKDPALLGEQARLLLDHALASGTEQDAGLARAHLEDLAITDPNHPDHVGRLGIARAMTGDDTGAEAAFKHAIRLAPQNAAHRANLETLLATEKSS